MRTASNTLKRCTAHETRTGTIEYNRLEMFCFNKFDVTFSSSFTDKIYGKFILLIY